MKQQYLLIVSGLAGVLLVANLATCEGEAEVNQLGQTAVTLSSFEADKARTIRIDKGEAKVEVTKQKDTWTLGTGHKADQRKAKELVDDLAKLSGEKRPAKMDQLDRYGLDEKSEKTIIKVLGEGDAVLAEVTLGKKGPDWGTAFTKRADKDEVLLLNEGPAGRVAGGELKLSAWIDSTVIRFKQDKTTSLKVSGVQTGEFSRPTVPGEGDAGPSLGDWKSLSAGPFNGEKFNSLMNRLDGLYLKAPLATAEGEAKLTFKASGGDDRTIELLSQPEEGDDRWVRVDGLGYVVSKSSFENVEKALTESLTAGE
ncbi:MAG: hypothetical protein CMH50_13590 [Myxococcales bacterium]|nr:hypothetical protein [Myxococcales bacterium]